jgi:hypothetical protein
MASFESTVTDVRDRFSGRGSDMPPQHEKLLNLIKNLKDEGTKAISGRLADMDQADKTYRAYRVADEDDKKAAERGEPVKIIYPITYAQIQTAIASLMAVFNKVPMLELEGRGPDYHRSAKLMELELQYQFEMCGWFSTMYQWFLDMFKYGFSELNIEYEKQYGWITHKDPLKNTILQILPMLSFMGINPETTEKVVMHEGAKLWCGDPKVTCFDPSVSIGEIQKGQFCFTQEILTYNQLKLEAAPPMSKWFNIDELPKAPDHIKGDNYTRPVSEGTSGNMPIKGGDKVVVDTCYVKICPRDYELSELNEPQIWCISMANEARIIKAEPSRYQHGMFPKAVIEYSPDMHNITNDGMAQTVDGLQHITNWLLNSHMESVRQVVDNHFIVDPSGIEVDDITNRRRFWRLKPGKASLGVDRFFKQVQTTDVTQQHIPNADYVLQFIQRTTGISDNFMGLQLPTTRSATEVQSINKLGSLRMKLLSTLVFESGFRPLGYQMIKNTQTWMETERFFRITSALASALMMPPEAANTDFVKVGPQQLQGLFNISMIDSTTPQDRIAVGNLLKEVMGIAVQNPAIVPLLGINVQQVMRQMLMNLGVRNISDFLANPMQMAQAQQLAAASAPGGPGVQTQVMPDEMVNKELQKGNIQPFGAR